jgi:hypothetical protein
MHCDRAGALSEHRDGRPSWRRAAFSIAPAPEPCASENECDPDRACIEGECVERDADALPGDAGHDPGLVDARPAHDRDGM